MDAETFGQLKQSLIDIVPRNSITINVPKKLILRAPNGSFVKFGHMAMPPELLATSPQVTIDMMHNKLLIQWTDDVDAATYENIAAEVAGQQDWTNPKAKEAFEWIAALYNIREAMGLS